MTMRPHHRDLKAYDYLHRKAQEREAIRAATTLTGTGYQVFLWATWTLTVILITAHWC